MIEINLDKKRGQKKRPQMGGGPRASSGGGGNIIPLILSIIIAIALIPLVFILQNIRINSIKKRTDDVKDNIIIQKEELRKRQEAIETLEGLKAEESRLIQRLNIISSLNAGRSAYTHLLQELANRLPDFTWILSLTEFNGLITVNGITLYDAVLPNLWDNLDNSEFLNDIQIQSWVLTETEGEPAVSFIITGTLNKTIDNISSNEKETVEPDNPIHQPPTGGGK